MPAPCVASAASAEAFYDADAAGCFAAQRHAAALTRVPPPPFEAPTGVISLSSRHMSFFQRSSDASQQHTAPDSRCGEEVAAPPASDIAAAAEPTVHVHPVAFPPSAGRAKAFLFAEVLTISGSAMFDAARRSTLFVFRRGMPSSLFAYAHRCRCRCAIARFAASFTGAAPRRPRGLQRGA